MNDVILPEDVVKTIQSFCRYNEGDESTTCIILAIGAELLNISQDKLLEMLDIEWLDEE